MAVVLILIFGLIIRGVLSIQSNTSTDERVASEDIAFDIVAETPRTQGGTDEKLYQERLANSQSKTVPEDVKISFDAIFVPETPKGETHSPVAHSSQVPGTTTSYTPAAERNAMEKTAIQQELDAIYNSQSQNQPNATATDESQTEPSRPLTKDEILAQQKKLMEEGFNLSDLQDPMNTNSDAAVSIASPSEIPAFIHGPQTVMVGNRLALRIDTSVILSNGQVIPRNSIIYAQIALNNNRVQVTVESIKFGTAIYSLELSGRLTETFVKELHRILKAGTSDSRRTWFRVGEYKKLPNEVGGQETTPPEQVAAQMKALLSHYNALTNKTLEDIVAFHHAFECIHPFQDGNGRVGRLIMFKECLANRVVPFIIDEDLKLFYYRGLHEWDRAHEYLLDTCRTAQDNFRAVMRYFKIEM
jgi:hypothetical protein